jgi:tetratricopeptide (TPR) repeat protein
VANPSVRLFLSCVSDEFRDYRDALRRALTRPNVEVKIQEDFKALGGDTLRMLEDYIAECEAVVHFVGEMAGSTPAASSVDDLIKRHTDVAARLAEKGMTREPLATLTYTQWEAWLAIGRGKNLLIVEPAEGVARGPRFAPTDASRASQAAHLNRLKAIGRFPIEPPFTSADNLAAQIVNSAVIDALVKARALPARQPRNLPFASLGPLFVGRETALDDLRAALEGAKGVAVAGRALHGLGGIGKTRLAIEYAWAREADYSALLFARADDAATLNASLAALAGASVLDLPEKEAREDAAKIEAALRWLEDHPTWLMILDNVDDGDAVTAVTKLMARLKGGHVIVTARAANFPASIRRLELDVLDEGPATEFLLERTAGDREDRKDDADSAREIARELGGLALGLEQAGAYIATEHIGFKRYLALLRLKREKVLDWARPELTGYPLSVGATWATSVEKLSPESRGLLERLAMLAADPIPDALIGAAVPGEAADYDAERARTGLYAYSLITRATGEAGAAKGFIVHRLVQDFARRAMTAERSGAALREALGWLNAAFVGAPDDVRSWPVLDPLAPHALVVARRADKAGIAELTGRLFNQLGLLLMTKARYAEAEPFMRRAVAIFEKTLGPNHALVATGLNNLAQLLEDTNRLAEAEPLMRRALAIDEASLGPNHPNVAYRLNNLASLLHTTNRLPDAEPLMRRALAISEAGLGPDHPHVAIRLNNLAQLLTATSRLAEAEPLMRRALAIGEASLGSDHPDVAIPLNNLASLLRATNRLAEAEPPMRRALAIDEKSFGPDHPNVATRLNNLAQLLSDTNRLAEAEPLMRRALKIDEARFGPDHPKVAIRLNNLAQLLSDTNRRAEAEPPMRRALAISEMSLGPEHPDVAIRLNNLAQLLQDTNRLAETEPLMRRALAIWEKSLGPEHPQVALGLNNLASMLQATNRLAEAEPLIRRALAIDEASFGPDHPNVAIRLNNLAGLLRAKNRPGEAEPLDRRALAIFEKSLGADHPNTVTVRENLAALKAGRRKGADVGAVGAPKKGFFERLFGHRRAK